MSSGAARLGPLTEADFFAIPEAERFHELLAGEIVARPVPAFKHGAAQSSVASLVQPYRRKGGSDDPDGWRFATECEVRLFPGTIVRPDVAGWRRARLIEPPDSGPVEVAPDWICEVLSRSNPIRDLWDKMQLYHEAAVPHYWVLDPDRQTLRVHQWAREGFRVVLSAGPEQTVRVEPFELLEIRVAELFDDR